MRPIRMRFGPTFRSGRMRPADGPSNGSATLSRIRSLADYTIAMLESSFRKRHPNHRTRRPRGGCGRSVSGSARSRGEAPKPAHDSSSKADVRPIRHRPSAIFLGDALEPFGHYLRMLDGVGDRIDDAGHQHRIFRQGLMLKHLVFVCVPWIGEWQVQAANFGPTQDRQNICERHVLIVRSLVVAPTDMEPHFVARNIDEGRVDGSDHSVNELLEI